MIIDRSSRSVVQGGVADAEPFALPLCPGMPVVAAEVGARNAFIGIGANGQQVLRIALRELLRGGRARIIGDDSDDPVDTASVILGGLSEVDMEAVRTRATHVREVLTGYRSGNAQVADVGEPRAEFNPHRPLMKRYAAKATELGVTVRTIGQWVCGDWWARNEVRTTG
jgi:hypothetical protein